MELENSRTDILPRRMHDINFTELEKVKWILYMEGFTDTCVCDQKCFRIKMRSIGFTELKWRVNKYGRKEINQIKNQQNDLRRMRRNRRIFSHRSNHHPSHMGHPDHRRFWKRPLGLHHSGRHYT